MLIEGPPQLGLKEGKYELILAKGRKDFAEKKKTAEVRKHPGRNQEKSKGLLFGRKEGSPCLRRRERGGAHSSTRKNGLLKIKGKRIRMTESHSKRSTC